MTNMLCVMSLKRIGEIPVCAYQSNEFASWLSTKTHKPMRSVSGFPANDNIHWPGPALTKEIIQGELPLLWSMDSLVNLLKFTQIWSALSYHEQSQWIFALKIGWFRFRPQA